MTVWDCKLASLQACKLAMHTKSFNPIRKNNMYDLCGSHNNVANRSSVTSFVRLKSCCHHSLRNLYVDADVHSWNWNSLVTIKTLITILIDISFVWRSFLIEGLHKHQWFICKRERKIHDHIVCSIRYDLLFSHNFEIFDNFLICACLYVKLPFL